MAELGFIIPCYNSGAQLWRAVGSVLSEKCVARLIVVDDGSQEPVALPNFFADDVRLTILRHAENRGAGAARNTGLDALKTEWIGFLDADDVLVAGTLESRLSRAKDLVSPDRRSLTMVASGWIEQKADRPRVRIPNPSTTAADLASGCWWSPGSAMLCHRSVFEGRDGESLRFDPSLRRLEDFELGLRFGLKGGALVVDDTASAIIKPGGRAAYADVNMAAETIVSRHAALRSTHADLWRNMRAYLELEKGAYALRERRWLKAASHLANSFFFRPRFKLHLSPGWTYRPAPETYL